MYFHTYEAIQIHHNDPEFTFNFKSPSVYQNKSTICSAGKTQCSYYHSSCFQIFFVKLPKLLFSILLFICRL